MHEGRITLTAPSSNTGTPVASGHKDTGLLSVANKLEVRDGQIVLNAAETDDNTDDRGGCELQVKDGKIVFKK